MAEVDPEATWRSLKAHTIIFIILILLANAGLIFKIARRNLLKFTFMYDAKKLTIVSLAIGDIFLALFTLAVRARQVFEYNSDLHCSTTIPAHVYGDFLINFVYGTGLVVLAVELIFRLKQPMSQSTTGSQNNIKAFIVSAIPWGFGLIIVLPLAMAGMDWDTCRNETLSLSRGKAMYGVSLCLPAILALLAGILVIFVSQSNNSSPAAPPVSQIPLQNPTTNVSYDTPTEHLPAQAVPAPGYQPQQNQQSSYPSSPLPYSGYAHSQPTNYPQEYNVDIPQPSNNQPPTLTYFNKEKGTLCLICIVHFICVIPFAGFYIGYRLNADPTMDALTATVLENLFYWLLFCRSVLAPLIWICRLED